MRRIIAFAPFLFVAISSLPAATTPMIELSKDDSAKAQTVHDALTAAQQAYTAMERQMYRGYVKDATIKGFPGPLYSADFRFLIGTGDPAPILALSKEDTAQLLAAYNALVQAQSDVEAFHQHLLETYIAVHGNEKPALSFGDPAVSVPAERAGFQHFRYTQDYRFILPK
jgi:hypothetical protein